MELRGMGYFFQLLIIFSKMHNQYVDSGFRELYKLTEFKKQVWMGISVYLHQFGFLGDLRFLWRPRVSRGIRNKKPAICLR